MKQALCLEGNIGITLLVSQHSRFCMLQLLVLRQTVKAKFNLIFAFQLHFV